jgi:hypothetical protein
LENYLRLKILFNSDKICLGGFMKEPIKQKLIRIARNRIALSYGISGKELVTLTGCSPTTALSVIKSITNRHPNLMVKTAKRWSVVEPDNIPIDWLSGFSMKDMISGVITGNSNLREAAILPDDIPISRVRFTAHNPIADMAIIMSIRASRYRKAGAHQRGAIRIRYVGLRLNEQAKWRTIIPVMLEEFSGKWRIIGIDADKNESRTFQLSRVIEVDGNLHPIPNGINAIESYSPKRRVKITLSDRLTEDQRAAAKNELGLNTGELLELTESQLHDMRHQYGVDKPTTKIVWPIIENVEII